MTTCDKCDKNIESVVVIQHKFMRRINKNGKVNKAEYKNSKPFEVYVCSSCFEEIYDLCDAGTDKAAVDWLNGKGV